MYDDDKSMSNRPYVLSKANLNPLHISIKQNNWHVVFLKQSSSLIKGIYLHLHVLKFGHQRINLSLK